MTGPVFLFAPGAGASSAHSWMQDWSRRLAKLGHIELFDYSYMRAGRRRPDPLPELIAAHRKALFELRERTGRPTFLIGKSMGGRVGCHVALETPVVGLICLGYPLCAGGDRSRLRDRVLLELETPILFVQGTRDPLCPLDLLEEVRTKMKSPNKLHIVEHGNHSLVVTKRDLTKTGRVQSEIDDAILESISEFVDDNLSQR